MAGACCFDIYKRCIEMAQQITYSIVYILTHISAFCSEIEYIAALHC